MNSHGQNFMREMAEAYGALEREPEHLATINTLREASRIDGERIASLEIKLHQRNNEIVELERKLTEVSKERDDAGFRELEQIDKANALRDACENIISSLGETLGVVDGTDRIRTMRMTEVDRKAYLAWRTERDNAWKTAEEAKRAAERPIEPSPPSWAIPPVTGSTSSNEESGEPIAGNGNGDPGDNASAASEATPGQSDTTPTVHSLTMHGGETTGAHSEGQSEYPLSPATTKTVESESSASSTATVGDTVPSNTEGQCEPLPTALEVHTQSTTASSGTADNLNDASSQGTGRYAGKLYHEHPYYVSEESWVANGGTLENYHYKPAQSVG